MRVRRSESERQKNDFIYKTLEKKKKTTPNNEESYDP